MEVGKLGKPYSLLNLAYVEYCQHGSASHQAFFSPTQKGRA